MAQAGADITWLARQMGHESTKLTFDTYIHLYPGSGERALKMLSRMLGRQGAPEGRWNGGEETSDQQPA
jgi:hypothetical protein